MNNELFSVGCTRCGSVHSYYGKEAELLWDIVMIYGKRAALRDGQHTAGVLDILEKEVKCCEHPSLRHGWRNYK